MSVWPGKFVIGLTGNISTGKSVVRKMLEHLGAYGIDADSIGHRAIAKNAPGYNAVVDTFGHWILAPDGQIDRPKLGRLVFADAEALASLEAIVHPLVIQAINILIRRVPKKVIVIEAIKLFESDLDEACDVNWVVYAPMEAQIARLVRKRRMTPEDARARILAQTPQTKKIKAADVVIRNDGTFEQTWNQVYTAWEEVVPTIDTAPLPEPRTPGEMVVLRARPNEADQIATLINRLSNNTQNMTRADVMAAFGEKAYLVLDVDGEKIGLVGWQVENLIARTSDVYIQPGYPLGASMRTLLEEVEQASQELQSEASLLFIPPRLARHREIWQQLGYKPTTVEELGVQAWQEAARESMPEGTVMLFKRLRKDRILKPV